MSQHSHIQQAGELGSAKVHFDKDKEHQSLIWSSEMLRRGDPLDYKILNFMNFAFEELTTNEELVQLGREDIDYLLIELPTAEDIL